MSSPETMKDNDDVIVEAVQDDINGPESAEPTETAKGIEEDMEEVMGKLEAAGVQRETLKDVVAEQIRQKMIARALSNLAEANKEGSRLNKLSNLWEALSDEGKTMFVENNTGFWAMIKDEVVNMSLPLKALSLFSTAYKAVKVRALSEESLSIQDFNTDEVKDLLALGVLDCPTEMQAKVDHEMSAKIGRTATALKLAQLALPELAPVEKGLAYAGKGREFMEAQLPAVRAEVQRQKMEVAAKLAEEHKEIVGDVTPQVDLNRDPEEEV